MSAQPSAVIYPRLSTPPNCCWKTSDHADEMARSRSWARCGVGGTNSLALLAGVPSVVVPRLFDQVSHGRRQQELGAGAWVRRPRDLPAAVRAVLDPAGRYASRARAFADSIADEDGTAGAIRRISQVLESHTS